MGTAGAATDRRHYLEMLTQAMKATGQLRSKLTFARKWISLTQPPGLSGGVSGWIFFSKIRAISEYSVTVASGVSSAAVTFVK